MFKEMNIVKRKLSQDEAKELLFKGEYGILTTVGEDGYPYGVPLNYVFEDEKIYFHGAQFGAKVDNIKFCDKVCFTVVGKTEVLQEKFTTKYESVIVYGRAKKFENKNYALKKIIDKYSPDFKESGLKYIDAFIKKTDVYEISIDYMSAKALK